MIKAEFKNNNSVKVSIEGFNGDILKELKAATVAVFEPRLTDFDSSAAAIAQYIAFSTDVTDYLINTAVKNTDVED